MISNKIKKKIKLKNDLSLLLPTSGSMGVSKFVKLSKKNLKHNAESIISYLNINDKDSTITNLPISYSYMLSIINTHLEVGGSIIISKYSLIEKGFWDIYKNSNATSFNGVPYTYDIITKIGLKNIKIRSLKFLTHAGGKSEKNNLKKIIKFSKKNNLKFFYMYGQTEASPRISYLKPEFAEKKIGSIGKGLPKNKIYLINNNGNKINEPFKEGEIICEGKNIFLGYSRNFMDLKNFNELNYKLRTGDLGYFDNDGFFYITSRNNRIAKIFGIRIDLEDLQRLMSQKGYKIICMSNNKKIYVYTKKKYNKTFIINTLSKITNLNKSSFDIIRIKHLPRTLNNKINYNKLKKINA